LCAELRRAEANSINPEQVLPRLVAARSLDGALDIVSVLHGRFSRYLDTATTEHRNRATPRYLLGLFPQTDDRLDPAMNRAVQERADALVARASRLLVQAIRDGEPWVAALGQRPVGPHDGGQWDEAARAVAAYRDAWQVTVHQPLGQPSGTIQHQDADRIRVAYLAASRPIVSEIPHAVARGSLAL